MINVANMSFLTDDVIKNLKDYAGNVTLSGLLIVFAMLIVLVILIMLFGKIMQTLSGESKPKAKKEVPAVTTAPTKASAPVAVSDDTDGEIVAAISAAIMMMYEGTGTVPVIRSIRRADRGSFNAWRAAGIANNTRSF